MTGVSRSFNYPRTNGVYGETFNSFATTVVTKINASGSAFIYSTNLRTSSGETAVGFAAILPAGIARRPAGQRLRDGQRPRVVDHLPQPDAGRPQPADEQRAAVDQHPAASQPAARRLPDVPDRTWVSPTGAEFPTSEAWIKVLNSTATALLFESYIGGDLDDFAYAPYVDDNGDVWAMGFTDGRRFYQRVSSTGAVTQYDRFSQLPTCLFPQRASRRLITNLALKATIDTNVNTQNPATVAYGFGYGALATQGVGTPATVNGAFARDGFIIKFRVNRPSVAGVSLNPATIPGGLGASSTGTVTLTQGAPSGGAQVTISLPDGTTNASLSPTNPDLQSITLDIPTGGTTATFTVYSKPVTVNTAVRIRATYTGTFRETTLQVVPWLVSLTVPLNSVVGGDPTSLRGTVTLAAPAPAGGVDVTLTSSSPGLVTLNGGEPFTVPAGQTSATFAIETNGTDVEVPVTLQATLLGVTRSASFLLVPANLQSITLTPDTIAGGSTSTVVATLNGEAGDAPYDVVLTSSDYDGQVPRRRGRGLGGLDHRDRAAGRDHQQRGDDRDRPDDHDQVGDDHRHAHRDAGPPDDLAHGDPAGSGPRGLLADARSDHGRLGRRSRRRTVTLSAAAPAGGAKVYVTVGNPDYATLLTAATNPVNDAPLPTDATGAYVTVPAGSKTATFRVQARYVGVQRTVAVTAQQSPGASNAKTATLTIRALAFTVSFNNGSVIGSDSGTNAVTGTITIAAAATEALTFTVSSSNTAVVPDPNPATVTIPAGSDLGLVHPAPAQRDDHDERDDHGLLQRRHEDGDPPG